MTAINLNAVAGGCPCPTGGRIRVTWEQLEAEANKCEIQRGQYISCYGKIYAEKENMRCSWTGEANQAYCTRLEGFRNDFEELSKLLLRYIEYLKMAAKYYKEVENRLKTEAGKLNIGR
jgi:WXG100 family type VII secretion target